MPVRIAGLERGAIAGPQRLLAGVGHQRQLALQHVDQLVLVGVPVPLARPDAGRQPRKVDPEGGEAAGLAEAPPGRAEAWAVVRGRVVATAFDGDGGKVELLHTRDTPDRCARAYAAAWQDESAANRGLVGNPVL